MSHLFYYYILPQRSRPSLAVPAVDPAALTENWQDTEEYMLLRLGKNTIGAMSTIVKRKPGGERGFTAEFRLQAGLGIGPMKQAIKILGGATLDRHLQLQHFTIQTRLPGTNIEVKGLSRPSELLLQVERDGKRQLSRVEVDGPLSLLEAARPAALKHFEIRPGNTITLPVADTLFSMQQGEVQITVKNAEKIELGGKQVEAHRVEMRMNDFVTNSWVDKAGNTLRRQVVGSLAMEATTPEQAKGVAEALNEQIPQEPLSAQPFKNVPLQKASDLAAGYQNPLTLLGGITQQR